MAPNASVLRLYRKLLKLAHSLPGEKRSGAIQQIQSEFRLNRDEFDQSRIGELMRKAESTVGYMKIVTPKKKPNGGVTTYTYVKGKRVEGTAAASDGAKHKVGDMETTIKRHHQLMRRQYFMDR